MQINTRITNSAYYETCSHRTYAENNLSVSFKMKYSENTSVNRSYEGRGKSAVDAYNELGSGKTNGIETSGNETSNQELKLLGKGFLMVGNHGYGISELSSLDEAVNVKRNWSKELASESDVANILTSETTMCTYPSDKNEEGTKYITVYSKTGIHCWKSGASNYASDWSINFENEEQYEKVKGLLEKFPNDYNFNFAAHQNFWEDYLSGAIDENEFIDFMNDSRNGIPNYAIGDEYNTRIDESKVKWAKYFNNPESRIYSGQKEFEKMVAKQLMGRNGELTGLHKSEMYKSDRKTAPYQHLADESGFINYKGVTFHCDAEKNQITLGDCSDPNKCMMVTLKDGGTLMVNYDNIEDLTKAITMFSPEDQVRIMRAITVHNMSKQAQKEIDDDKNSIGDNPIGKYRDNALGFNVEVYESEKGNSLYTIKTKYDDGREVVREVDADSIDASDCSIIDLFAKLKHLEKNGKCENATLDFVISHLYMNYRKPGADENTKIDFKKWFEQQLELEKKQKTGFYPHQLEKLLLYL